MGDLLNQFGINYTLLIAQMINFGILFWVLYKFVYKPILKVLDDRRTKIERSLDEAKKIEQRTQALEVEVNTEIGRAKKEADRLVAEAREIGEKVRAELLTKTQSEAEAILAKARRDIELERVEMNKSIKEYVVTTSLLVVEKVLSQKLSTELRQDITSEAINKLS